MNIKDYKHIWLPGILLLYFVIMAWIERENFLIPERRTTFVISVLFEITIIIGLFFALRKKARLQKNRENLDKTIRKLSEPTD